MASIVYYAESDLCDPNVDTSKGVPSRKINPYTGKMLPWPSPYILMVDRGNCSFVQKVRNAQRSGAASVLIADNICLCSDEACINKSNATTCQTRAPSLADDGSGSDISIPSFLMFKVDADAIKDELLANRPVQVEMAWHLPNPDGHVDYDLWMTPTDFLVSGHFIADFKSIAQALGDRARFTPYMYIFDGWSVGCHEDNYCRNLCTNHGRYCLAEIGNGVTGTDAVVESLRRLCVWHVYKTVDGSMGREWWEYVVAFNERCAKNFGNQTCIHDAYQTAQIDGAAVESCIEDSGGTNGDVSNSVLERELDAQSERGVVATPTACVESVPMRSALTARNVFREVCQSYSTRDLPQVCRRCADAANPVDCVSFFFLSGRSEPLGVRGS